ncbi:peptidase [Paremcibacter congregatus]|uniref:Peptidase n=1 Tax=Paremcibacter congregatus TaxID=2043170 RepID=A0A2G4YMT0_9PROT|nr:peptidase [Paremcibacter congregatus]PHZ83639.1 peptidase [Paremcibacter congregatus]QDE27342.1 peptidase [Paremcibacter congregatus]
MTYCLGIRVKEGLVCLADGRLTSGMQAHNAGKVSLHQIGPHKICIMTSGLRSIRDKTLAYFDDACRKDGKVVQPMLRNVLHYYTEALRQVATEDWDALQRSHLRFDLHALIGGQLDEDEAPCMYLVYPEGNWVEMNERASYMSIGATSYGKTFLDRTLDYDTPLRMVIKIAYLAFDSTRVSTVDVGYPLDLLTYASDRKWRHELYAYDDLAPLYEWWNSHLVELLGKLPDGCRFKNLLP